MDNIDEKFEALLTYLRDNRGFDFTSYKRPGLLRRVEKRMQLLGIADVEEYRDFLEVHPEEFTLLFNTILINVTGFFRDEAAWEYLAQEVLPKLLQRKSPQDPIRVWSAGCANGAEAYTLVMTLAELLGIDAFRERVKIYATDIDDEALAQARQGSFSEKEVEGVPPALLAKYFTRTDERYLFRSDLRRTLIFGRHDLLRDAPISHLDLLVCRNTLMYFNAEAQGHIIRRFHYALNDDGVLFLGKAETMLSRLNLFAPLSLKYRIFQKLSFTETTDRFYAAAMNGNGNGARHKEHEARVMQAAFESATTPMILVDSEGRLCVANNAARTTFAVSAAQLGRPFHELDLSYKPADLRSLIDRAGAEHRAVSLANVQYTLPGGQSQYFDIQAVPLQDQQGALGTRIAFIEQTALHNLQDELQRKQQELATAIEDLQATTEELETTNEELQSTNEELETTNEELQSTNEELETMNEELQSSNEELQTMNDEMQLRSDELNRVNAYLESILASLHSAVIVTDQKLNVLLWNHWSEEMWGLHADEVKEHALLTLDIGLPVEQLAGPLRQCLNGEQEYQEIVLTATNRRGRTFPCRVAIAPLLGVQRDIQGTILIMKEMEADGTAR